MTVDSAELERLVRREHANPHGVLGAHPSADGVIVRALRPAATGISVVLDDGSTVELTQIHPGGVFEGVVEGAELPLHYRLNVDYGAAGSFTIEDPYAFLPTLGEIDLHLIGEGRHEELYERLGAHVQEHQGVGGTAFAVWAPAARAVSVVGDFNSWDGRLHAMRSLGSGGVWAACGSCSCPGWSPALATSTRS
jgi:1,4-alpha-glucan branching enzyme